MTDLFDGLAFGRPEVLRCLYGLPLLAVFYLLRRRASRVDVPFLAFWERVLATHRRRPSTARLLLSLLLQAAIFAAFLVAAADPYRETTERVVARTLLILDRTAPSAPFAAEVALRAEASAQSAVKDGEVVVAVWNRGTILRIDVATDGGAAADAVRKAPPAAGPRDPAVFEDVVAAAAASTRIVLVTPFDAPGTPAFRRAEIVAVAGFGVGATERNGGLRGVVAVPDGLFVRTEGAEGRTLRLVRNGTPIAEAPASRATRLAIQGGFSGAATLELVPEDAWATDDVVRIASEDSPRFRVLVAADAETPALDAALFASGVVDPQRSSRTKTAVWRDAARDYDVVILIGRDEEAPLPKGRYLLFDASAPGLSVARTGGVGPARATVMSASTPWLRNLDLDEWDVRKTSEFTATDGAEVLVEGDRGPLVYRARHEGATVIGVSPSPTPAASTLPLSAVFPVLVRGALLELGASPSGPKLTVSDPAALTDPLPPGVVPAVDRLSSAPAEATRTSGPPERRPAGAPFLLAFLALVLIEWALFHAGFTD